MKYKVVEIIEPDFGCEGLPDGSEPMCEVVLEQACGEQITVTIADGALYAGNIREGDIVIYSGGTLVKAD